MLTFVHIEKTAGMSVHQVFERCFGARIVCAEPWPLSRGLRS